MARERPHHSIFWVDATSIESIEYSYRNIWESIGEPQGPFYHPIQNLVYHLNWELCAPWLIILDGIEASTLKHMVLIDWVPSGLCGTLLLTTRDASVSGILGSTESVQMPPLPPLSLWEAIQGAEALSEFPSKAYFWPEGCLRKIITKNIISTELYRRDDERAPPRVDNELVHFVRENGTKLLTICVMCRIRESELERAMGDFRKYGLNDQSLPVSQEILFPYAQRLQWYEPDAINFLQHQWKFVVPKFSMGHCLMPDLPEGTILPFLELSRVFKGNFGMVYKVRVHPSHFDRDDPIHNVRYQFLSSSVDCFASCLPFWLFSILSGYFLCALIFTDS